MRLVIKLTEVPKGKKETSLSYCITLRECNHVRLHRGKIKTIQNENGSLRYTLLMQLKTRDTNWNDINIFFHRGKIKKGKKTFSH